MADGVPIKPSGLRRKASLNVTFCVKKKRDATLTKVSRILQKSEKDRSQEEVDFLSTCSNNIVKEVKLRHEKRKQILARSEEFEDSAPLIGEKCAKLAAAISSSRNLVVYSGAGVSTAASIPDYRGTNGIWTRLQQGKDIGEHDLSGAEPTTAHMALYSLYRVGLLKHVVSQNCDGLHLRSGLPRRVLSEVHGNMNLEVCTSCNMQVWRAFDVTQYTGRYAHLTGRLCPNPGCMAPLRDTIVHFGERGSLAWPINWSGASAAAKQADMILCMGSSLKVLKRYPWLWGMDKPIRKRPQLYIVNLQWTPKDDQATLKINGKCDDVMKLVLSYLNLDIPKYDRGCDPIFSHATQLHQLEEHTTSTQKLVKPEEEEGGVKEEQEQEVEEEEELRGRGYTDKRLEQIVTDIKREKDIWRPYGPGVILPSVAVTGLPQPSVSAGFSVQVEFFDRVYQELAKKVLQQTDDTFYHSFFEEEGPLDLSKPKMECSFCYDNYTKSICQFYKRRETREPDASGRSCYCCDSEEELEEKEKEKPLSLGTGGPEQSTGGPGQDSTTILDKKTTNPGWFGKGYRKRIKKKR